MQSDGDQNQGSLAVKSQKSSIEEKKEKKKKERCLCITENSINIIKLIRKKETKTPEDLEKLV